MDDLKDKIIYWSDDNTIKNLNHSICNNEISITSTDTILGFLGNITKKSFENIIKIKGRKEDKPFLILVDFYSKIFEFVEEKEIKQNKNLLLILEKFWPGPLTIIFNAKKNLPNFLKSKQNGIAIRCPKHDGLQKILQFFNGLFSTSANKTGDPIPDKLSELNLNIIDNIKHIVLDKNNIDTNYKLYQTFPSTIIDVTNRNYVKIIREGAIPTKELEKVYGENFVK